MLFVTGHIDGRLKLGMPRIAVDDPTLHWDSSQMTCAPVDPLARSDDLGARPLFEVTGKVSGLRASGLAGRLLHCCRRP